MPADILDIRDLSVIFRMGKDEVRAVDNVSFTLKKGSTLGIVGESGSGKSVTALSVMRLLPAPPAVIKATKMLLFSEDETPVDLFSLPERAMRQIRGNRISLIFQEPMTSLNPVTRCGAQVMEAIHAHRAMSRKEAKEITFDLFHEVLLPQPRNIFHAYPHELSGGQKQRVMISMAVASKPDILIADEPTTALDVTVQRSIIRLLRDLQSKYGMAMLFITHDLGLISGIADELIVMKEGKIVETGAVKEILSRPAHPYTLQLLASRKALNNVPQKSLEMHTREPLVETNRLQTYFGARGKNAGNKAPVKAVDGVTMKVYPGEVLGLVGESGCGKTTLGRSILRLVEPTGGVIRFRNYDLTMLKPRELKKIRKEIQIIFQDPYSSLNPRHTVGSAITEPMKVHRIGQNRHERENIALGLLEKVGLDPQYFHRYPHELSGGQRQRVCIARALSVNPSFIICDESVSALDLTIQAKVLALLKTLRAEFDLTYIFISHDLSVVRYISDRIAVMKNGKIEETGLADEIYFNPKSDYTKSLIASIPS
jgi:peptide/nickel transport system ATP-binding protein